MPLIRSLKDQKQEGASNAHQNSKGSVKLPSVPALQKIQAGSDPIQLVKTVVNRATGVERQEADNYVLRWGEKFKDEPAPLVVAPGAAEAAAVPVVAEAEAEAQDHDDAHDDQDHEEEAPTFEFQITKSARKHYKKPYNTYNIKGDEQLQAFINLNNDVDVTSDQDIDLGSVTIGGLPKDCNIRFRNEWDGNHCVIFVWHCGPTFYRYG